MKVRRLSQKDEKQLTELRVNAYEACRWFRVKNMKTLSWSKDDQSSFVLGLEKNGKLIASCCFSKVFEKSVMEKKLDTEIDANITFPSLKIAKAVVALEKRGHGLMNALHYFVYKALLDKNVDIHSIGSLLNEGVGRTGLKKEMGFEFTRAKTIFDNDYEEYTPVNLIVLKKKNFSRGLSVSEKYSKYPIESFEVEEGMMRDLIQYMKTPSAELLPAR
jgi:hypothetical protein